MCYIRSCVPFSMTRCSSRFEFWLLISPCCPHTDKKGEETLEQPMFEGYCTCSSNCLAKMLPTVVFPLLICRDRKSDLDDNQHSQEGAANRTCLDWETPFLKFHGTFVGSTGTLITIRFSLLSLSFPSCRRWFSNRRTQGYGVQSGSVLSSWTSSWPDEKKRFESILPADGLMMSGVGIFWSRILSDCARERRRTGGRRYHARPLSLSLSPSVIRRRPRCNQYHTEVRKATMDFMDYKSQY